MGQYSFYFDGTRCTGCKTCAMACKDYKDLRVGFAYRKVYEITQGETVRDEQGVVTTDCVSYTVSLACNHCQNPVCVEVCPTGAMHKDSATGIVSVNTTMCIGCGYCFMSCPYNAPKVDREKGHSVKCDGCMERIAQDRKPVCVEACPARALDFAPYDQVASLGEQAAIAPLPDPSHTNPNLLIRASKDAIPFDEFDQGIVNPLEVQ